MSEESKASGIGLFGILTIIFVIAKIAGYIDWSWWLVLLPMWGPIALILGILVVCFIFALVSALS